MAKVLHGKSRERHGSGLQEPMRRNFHREADTCVSPVYTSATKVYPFYKKEELHRSYTVSSKYNVWFNSTKMLYYLDMYKDPKIF